MNLYSFFYCRAFDWYNTKGENEDTRRVSAIVLLSVFPTMNFLSVLFLIGLIIRKTPGNALLAVGVYVILLIYNFFSISTQKSNILRGEYKQFSENENRRLKSYLMLYVWLSIFVLLLLFAVDIYIKHKYGNYDSE